MALERIKEGERPTAVSASFSLHRGWTCKVLSQAKDGRQNALLTTGRPRTLAPAQERQVIQRQEPASAWL